MATKVEVPESNDPVSTIAIGNLDSLEELPPALQDRELTPRTRAFNDFLFFGRSDRPTELVPSWGANHAD